MSAETMGVEEEFLLVDPASGATVPLAEKVVARASAADLPTGATVQAEVARLVNCGVLADEAQTFWFARPSPRLPTAELRVADTASTVEEAILQALLGRALVRTALADLERGREAEPVPAQLAAAAVWSAARYGLLGPGVHLGLARRMPAIDLVTALLDHVRDSLTATGDVAEVHALVDRLRSGGTGADRQRRIAGAGGLPAVVTGLTLRDEPGDAGVTQAHD